MDFVDAKNEIPRYGFYRHDLKKYLRDFMASNVGIATVDFSEGEYKNATSCQASLGKSIRRFGFPIKATVRDAVVYLIRLDI